MDYIPQFEPWIDSTELTLLSETITDNWITGGKKVKEFEKKIAGLCRVKYAVSCMNGTVALFMALKAAGIGEGDEVIVPDFTFIASANSIVMAGATPVFIDIDKNTLNISTGKIEEAITPRTKAIMPVHIYGQAAEIESIMHISREYKLLVVEDAAQGIGVSWNGKPVGSFGEAGCLSFYADKTITTGEGGMVVTDNEEIAQKCLRLAHQGNLSKGNYIHESIGYNFRMTDMQAAVGLCQLTKLGIIIARKRTVSEMYKELLKDIAGVSFLQTDSRSHTVPFRHIIFVDDPQLMVKELDKAGVGAKRVFYPLHKQPCYKDWELSLYHKPEWSFENSNWAYKHGIALPSSVRVSRVQIEYICDRIKEILQR